MMYKAIVIEDEKKSRDVLLYLLQEYCPDVSVIGTADTIEKGVELIESLTFDILFLDIEMRTATGFDLLERLTKLDFETIFTTAYEKYAVKAIKFGAVDYLLKPVDVNELKLAIEKAVERKKKHTRTGDLADFLKTLDFGRVHKISISTTDGVLYIDVKQIIRCEAQGAYTVVYLKNKTKIMASRLLKEFESLLADYQFFRVHNSHLININEVQRYIRSEGLIEMNDGNTVAISLNRRDEFMNRMRSTK